MLEGPEQFLSSSRGFELKRAHKRNADAGDPARIFLFGGTYVRTSHFSGPRLPRFDERTPYAASSAADVDIASEASGSPTK